MGLGRKSAGDFHDGMSSSERAAAHAALAEKQATVGLTGPDKIASLAAAHATLALYFQRESEQGR